MPKREYDDDDRDDDDDDDQPRRKRRYDDDDDEAPSIRKDRLAGEDLRQIAIYQKGILVCILAYIIVAASGMFVAPEIRLIIGVAGLTISITATVFVFLLATQVYSAGQGVLLGLLTLIPCVGLLVLLIINSKATGILQANGIRVGLLGAKMSDVD
jgi:hypothetical protein